MSIFDDLTEPDPEPGSPDWSRPSRAVIASDGDNGWVMFMVGPHIAQQCEDLGTRELEGIGLTCVAGIHVWEGVLVGGGGCDFRGEYDEVDLRGSFRDPTEAEWAYIREGACPWNPDDWVVKDTRDGHSW